MALTPEQESEYKKQLTQFLASIDDPSLADTRIIDIAGSLEVDPQTGETEPLDVDKTPYYIERCRQALLQNSHIEPEIIEHVIRCAVAGAPKRRGPKIKKSRDCFIAVLWAKGMVKDGIGISDAVRFAAQQLDVAETDIWNEC